MKDTYKQIDSHQYEILRTLPESIQNEYAAEILKLAKKDEKILDVGYGSGLFIIPASKLNKDAVLYGIDYSKTLHDAVTKSLGNKAAVILGDLLEFTGSFEVIHFKAILHCFDKPEETLDKIRSLSKPGGYIVTGHEDSQIEDRIEQLFNNTIIDPDLELLFEYYFSLRFNMGKPFMRRKYPAGDATVAVNYICNNTKFTLEKRISNEKLSWERTYCLNDLLYSIQFGTFNVFSVGLRSEERNVLYTRMLEFSNKHGLDMKRERRIPANFKLYIIKHNP